MYFAYFYLAKSICYLGAETSELMRALCYSFCQLPQKVSPKTPKILLKRPQFKLKFQAPTPTPTVLIISDQDLDLRILYLFISCFVFNQKSFNDSQAIFFIQFPQTTQNILRLLIAKESAKILYC